jgi:hypothetical protein
LAQTGDGEGYVWPSALCSVYQGSYDGHVFEVVDTLVLTMQIVELDVVIPWPAHRYRVFQCEPMHDKLYVSFLTDADTAIIFINNVYGKEAVGSP